MDKELAKHFSNPNGFITEIDIAEDKLLVTTATCENGEPQECDLSETQQHLDHFEAQYNIVISNRDEIIKRELKGKKKVRILGICIAVLAIPTGICFGELFGGIGIIVGGLTTVVGTVLESNYKEKFKRSTRIYNSIIKNKRDIDRAIENDDNVTRYLNKSTQARIEENKVLQEAGIVEHTVNINFVDKTPLEDLEKLYKRTQISNALQEEPVFDATTKPQRAYTRKRTPNQNRRLPH